DAEKLRIKEDTFLQFFNEHLQADPNDEILFKDIYGKYSDWYANEIEENKKYIPSKKSIGKWLDKSGFLGYKPSGAATRKGLRFKTAIELAMDNDDQNSSGKA
ncbi:MAG: hypothetical protein KAU50_02975, partial [Candidatus Marinimicrobia bacterium]|nr:hypothetical protein [Candidatus Neomarinimicrobiota bacterium]